MKPQTIGRVLGIGLRVAGRIAGDRLAASPTTKPSNTARIGNAAAQGRTAGRAAGQLGRGVAGGVGGFLRPFRRVGGILWLEVTGVFFTLPVIVFTPTLWRVRANWQSGPEHKTFLVTAVIIAIFLYLSVSSFWRAHRR